MQNEATKRSDFAHGAQVRDPGGVAAGHRGPRLLLPRPGHVAGLHRRRLRRGASAAAPYAPNRAVTTALHAADTAAP